MTLYFQHKKTTTREGWSNGGPFQERRKFLRQNFAVSTAQKLDELARGKGKDGSGSLTFSHATERTCISRYDWTSDDIIYAIDRHREFPSFSRRRNKFPLAGRLTRYSYLPGKYAFTRYREGKKSCQRAVSVWYRVNLLLQRCPNDDFGVGTRVDVRFRF